MSACPELKRDHDGLVRLLTRAARTSARSRSARSELLDRAHAAFETCAESEDRHLLGALRLHGSPNESLHGRLLSESIEGLAAARRMFEELRDTDPGDPLWIARLIPLAQHVERRIEQQRRELFPLAKRLLGRDRGAGRGPISRSSKKAGDQAASLWV